MTIDTSIQQGMAQAIRLGYRIDLPRSPRRPGTVAVLTLAGVSIGQRDEVDPEKVTDTIAEIVQCLVPSSNLDHGRWGWRPSYNSPGACHYCSSGGPDGDHQRTVCRACDMPQCLYPSKCRICLVGYINGVSYGLYGNDSQCGYKSCTNAAVAEAPRVKRVCRDHLARVTRKRADRTVSLADDIAERIAMLGQAYGVRDWQRTYWFPEGAAPGARATNGALEGSL